MPGEDRFGGEAYGGHPEKVPGVGPGDVGAVDRDLQQQAWEREMGAANLKVGRGSGVYRQLDDAALRQRGALRSQAASGGANPFAQRHAAYQGGQLGSDINRLKDQMAQMEAMQLSEMQVGALGNRSQYELSQQQMENQMLEQLYAQEAAKNALAMQRGAMQDEYFGKILGGSLQAYGSMMSDERRKNMQGPNPRIADATLEQLTQELRKEDAGTVAKLGLRGSAEDPYGGEADRIAADLRKEDEKTLQALKPEQYEYDQQAQAMGAPSGPRYGVTAQQLEKTPLGQQVVVDTPVGKVVDTNQATLQQYGLIGRLNERVQELEQQTGKEPARPGAARAMVDAQFRNQAGLPVPPARYIPEATDFTTPFAAGKKAGDGGVVTNLLYPREIQGVPPPEMVGKGAVPLQGPMGNIALQQQEMLGTVPGRGAGRFREGPLTVPTPPPTSEEQRQLELATLLAHGEQPVENLYLSPTKPQAPSMSGELVGRSVDSEYLRKLEEEERMMALARQLGGGY